MTQKEENKIRIKEGFVGQKMMVFSSDTIEFLEQNTLNNGFFITAIGYYPKAAYHDRERPDGCEEYILLYCIDGEGEVRIGKHHFDLYPNSFIIIPPFESHHYRSKINNPWSIYWVHFKGKMAEGLYNKYISRQGIHTGSVAYSEKRLDSFTEAIDLLYDRFSQNHIEYSSLLIFNFIVNVVFTENFELFHFEEDKAENAMQYLKNNLNQNININALAAQFNLSVSRFSKIFKDKSGYSPIQYLILSRVHKSCEYLHFTDLSVKEIAQKVGFDDQYYFSRMFKKLMGRPPTKYRSEYNK